MRSKKNFTEDVPLKASLPENVGRPEYKLSIFYSGLSHTQPRRGSSH